MRRWNSLFWRSWPVVPSCCPGLAGRVRLGSLEMRLCPLAGGAGGGVGGGAVGEAETYPPSPCLGAVLPLPQSLPTPPPPLLGQSLARWREEGHSPSGREIANQQAESPETLSRQERCFEENGNFRLEKNKPEGD